MRPSSLPIVAFPPGPDFVAFSGHKLYAPYGAGALIGPRDVFATGDPFLAGGGAVDLVDLDEVIWTEPPEREEAGSPNVIGAVAFGAAMDELDRIGWDDDRPARGGPVGPPPRGTARHRRGARPRARHRPGADTLAVAAFTVEGMHHALVAARLSAEFGIGVRHGCFCAHPYLLRLLGVGPAGVADGTRGRPARRPQRDPRRGARQLRAWGPRATTSTPCSTRCGPWLDGGAATGALRTGRRSRGLLARWARPEDGATATAPPERPAPVGNRYRRGAAGPELSTAARDVLDPVGRVGAPRCGAGGHAGRANVAWVTTEASVTEPGSVDHAGRPDQRTPSSPRSVSATSRPRPACPPPWPSPRTMRICWWSRRATTC